MFIARRGRWVASATLVLSSLLAAAGCATAPGQGFFPFSEPHRLIPATQALRLAYPEPAPLPRELDKRLLPPYVVEPGDVLLIQPVNLDSPVRLPADQPVLPDGTINLGPYGRIVVAGRTVDQIETLVRSAVLAQTPDAGPILVRIINRVSKVFYVLGEVNAPGAFPLLGRETVLDGILAAGGLTDQASRKKIVLSRPTPPDGCRVVLPICYNEIVQIGDTATNYQLAPGDRIFVASRSFWEDLFDKDQKPDCPPCGRPQAPCPLGHGADHFGPGHPAPVPPAGEADLPVLPPPQKVEPERKIRPASLLNPVPRVFERLLP